MLCPANPRPEKEVKEGLATLADLEAWLHNVDDHSTALFPERLSCGWSPQGATHEIAMGGQPEPTHEISLASLDLTHDDLFT
jgi:hypothetical protein